MDCLVAPVSALKRRCSGRYGYQQLVDDEEMGEFGSPEDPVMVVVGKEKREFRVDPFVLRESPFRVLIDLVNGNRESGSGGGGGGGMVVLVDVDSILFEHMLWLMSNDCSSLFKLNLKEILDFYALDN